MIYGKEKKRKKAFHCLHNLCTFVWMCVVQPGGIFVILSDANFLRIASNQHYHYKYVSLHQNRKMIFLLEKLLGFQMYVRLLRTNGFREICLLKPNKMKYPPWLKIIVLWSPQKRISQSVSVKKMSFGFTMYAQDFTKIIENLPLMHLSLNIAGGRKEILV